MKWVKASEQLPPYRSDWPYLHYKLDGYKADGILMESEEAGIIWFEQKTAGTYKDAEDLSRVEWLDESTPSLQSFIARAREIAGAETDLLIMTESDLTTLYNEFVSREN